MKGAQLAGLLAIAAAAALVGTAAVHAQEPSGLKAPGAAVEKVKSGFVFTEGPAADAEGNVYFSDVRAARIYKWSCKDGAIAVHRENTVAYNEVYAHTRGGMSINFVVSGLGINHGSSGSSWQICLPGGVDEYLSNGGLAP